MSGASSARRDAPRAGRLRLQPAINPPAQHDAPPLRAGHWRVDSMRPSGFGSRPFAHCNLERPMLSKQRPLFAIAGAFAVLATLVLAAMPSAAQTSWPQRTVRFLVTLGPGSGIDIGTRLLADR